MANLALSDCQMVLLLSFFSDRMFFVFALCQQIQAHIQLHVGRTDVRT